MNGPGSFGSLKELPSFVIPVKCPDGEDGFMTLARAGFAVNAEEFRGHLPGRLLLNSIRLRTDGVIDATLTPLLGVAGEHIRRADFTELFD